MTRPRADGVVEHLIAGYRLMPVSAGESAARVFRLTKDGAPNLFLKTATGRARAELIGEAERLRWLTGRASVPRVIAFATGRTHASLLMEALLGCNAGEMGPEHARAVAIGLARALRQLHEQPVTGCPFDQRLAVQIERARERTDAGVVDEDAFDEERLGRRAAELLRELDRERPAHEDLVLTHGDASLANAMFEGERFVGFIDCGRAGVADRYQDLALAARGIRSNFGPEWLEDFFATYGLPEPDPSKLAYYRLLDEFF